MTPLAPDPAAAVNALCTFEYPATGTVIVLCGVVFIAILSSVVVGFIAEVSTVIVALVVAVPICVV